MAEGVAYPNLLRARGNSEDTLGLNAVVESVLGNRRSPAHVLVRGVGAGADQTDLQLLRPLVGLDGLFELRNRGGKVGRERTVDMGLELRQVDLDQLVVRRTLVLVQLGSVGTSEVTDFLALGGGQILVHRVVEWEERGGCTNLSTHVANGAHTSAAQAVDTWAVVFLYRTSAKLLFL